MPTPNFAILDADGNGLTELDLGFIDPGQQKEFEFQYENISGKDLENVSHFPYPGLVNDSFENTVNNPIVAVEIIKQSNFGVNQTSTLEETDSDSECPAYEERGKVYEYIGGTFTPRDTGAINMMAGASDYVIQMCDRKILNTYLDPDTPGSYTGFSIQLWNGSAWFTPTFSDGSSGASTAGNIRISAASAASWEKLRLTGTGITSPVYGYPIKYICTAVTIQAVLKATKGLYWNYAYELPKVFLKGIGEYHLYTAPSGYVQIYPTYEYPNLGLIVFQDNPFSGVGTAIRCAIEFKLPQPGTYEVVATGAGTVTVEQDSGGPSADIGVVPGINPVTGAYYPNGNIVPGINIYLSELTSGDTGEFTVSDALKYLDWSDDDSTYYNNDIDLSDMNDGTTQTVYGIYSPSMFSEESDNKFNFKFMVEGS